MLFARENLGDDDIFEFAALFFDPFHFDSKHGQALSELVRRPIKINVIL